MALPSASVVPLGNGEDHNFNGVPDVMESGVRTSPESTISMYSSHGVPIQPGYVPVMVAGKCVDRNFNSVPVFMDVGVQSSRDLLQTESPFRAPMLAASQSTLSLANESAFESSDQEGATSDSVVTALVKEIKHMVLGVKMALCDAVKEELHATSSMFRGDVRNEFKKELANLKDELRSDWSKCRIENASSIKDLRLGMASVARNLENVGSNPMGNEFVGELQKMRTEIYRLMPSLNRDSRIASAIQPRIDDAVPIALSQANCGELIKACNEISYNIQDLINAFNGQIVGIVDPSRGQLEDHMQRIDDHFNSSKDMLNDFSCHFEKLRKDKQDNLGFIAQVEKATKDHRVEIDLLQVNRDQQLENIHRTMCQIVGIVDPSRRELEDHMQRIYDHFNFTNDMLKNCSCNLEKIHMDKQDNLESIPQVEKAMRDHRAELEVQFDRLHQKQEDRLKEISGHIGNYIDFVGSNNKADKDMEKVLALLHDHKTGINNHATSLHKNTCDLCSSNAQDILSNVRNALRDHQKEISLNFEKWGNSSSILETITVSLDRLHDTVDQALSFQVYDSELVSRLLLTVRNHSTDNDYTLQDISEKIDDNHFTKNS